MTRILVWLAGTKLGRWCTGTGAMLIAVAAACLYWFERGRRAQASDDDIDEQQSFADAAEQVVKAARARAEVENEVAKQPEAPTQKVADAASDTAAGKLRDDGWTH